MKITILTDTPNSWILPYIKDLKKDLATKHKIHHVFKTSDIIADVKGVLGSDQVTAVEQGLQLKISEEKTPTRGSFVPAS